MFLSSDCKKALDIVRNSTPDLPNDFYSIEEIFRDTDYTYQDIFSILNYLEESGCIYVGDKQRTAIRLQERGRNYEEFQRHDFLVYLMDKWIEILAIIMSIIALIVSIV